MGILDDIGLEPTQRSKKDIKVFLIVFFVLSSVFLASLLVYNTTEVTEGETETEIDVSPSSISHFLPWTSPTMALATSRISDASAKYWAWWAIDGSYYDTDPFPDAFYETFDGSQRMWLGDDVATEWTMSFDLGAPRRASAVRFQFGDLYTSWGYRFGMKHFKYDFKVETQSSGGTRSWKTIATGVVNQPTNENWEAELTSSSDTDINLVNPSGCVYDEVQTDWVVADGSGHNVKVFNGGSFSYDIYYDDVHGDWSATTIADVAIIPKFRSSWGGGWLTVYDGGYYIATQDGQIWEAEYGNHDLIDADLVTRPGEEFTDIKQIATAFDADYTHTSTQPFRLYVLESNTLYYYELLREEHFTRASRDNDLPLGFTAGAIEAVGDKVYVVDEDTDDIYVYNAGLTAQVGTIQNTAFSNPKDLAKWWNNLLVLDDASDKVVNIELSDNSTLGDYPISHNGSSPKIVAGLPTGSYSFPLVCIASTTNNVKGKIMVGNTNIRNNPVYYDWEEYEMVDYGVTDKLTSYKVRIYDMTFQQNPLSSFPIPKVDTSTYGWNKPCLVETFYDWQYEEDDDGIEMEILQPEDGENFISYGVSGSFNYKLSVGSPTSDAEGTSDDLNVQAVKYNVDGGGWVDATSSYIKEKLQFGAGSGKSKEWTEEFPVSYLYLFKTPFPYGFDGDVWDVKLDGTKIGELDEDMMDGSKGSDYSFGFGGGDLFAEYIERGTHTIRFESTDGSAKTIPQFECEYKMWSKTGYGLSEGYHNFGASASDSMGSTVTQYNDFNVITYPSITINSPEQDVGYNNDIDLNFDADDNNIDSAWWYLNGELKDVTDDVVGTNIHYETTIPIEDMLSNDYNQIEVQANDTDGHLSFAYRSFFLDFTPPRISFPGMVNNSYLPVDNMYYINVTDETLTKAYYYINQRGVNFDLVEGLNAVEIYPYEFDEGFNNITVYAEDMVGNTATAYLNLSKDESPPVINITAPKNLQKFWKDSTPDAVPLNATAYDLIINRTATEKTDISQPQIDDYIRLHYNYYTSFSQELVPSSARCITSLDVNARGFGRLKLSLYKDKYLQGDPVTIGYKDIGDELSFHWYSVDMSNVWTQPNRMYYLKVESLTPFNDIAVSIGNDPYEDGKITMGAIPRPQWDLSFKWHYKPIVNSSQPVLMSYTVDSQTPISPVETNEIIVPDLRSYYSFSHGYRNIRVFAADEAGNDAEEVVTIQYIDTSVTTNIDVQLSSYTDSEWVFKNDTVSWISSVPDYTDRVTKETYTYDVYLKDIDEVKYPLVDDAVDINQVEFNSSKVPDGFYYIVVNATDGTTRDVEQSALIRIINGNPTVNINYPPTNSYVTESTVVNITVLCPDISSLFYSVDEGINNEITNLVSFNFFEGYSFVFVIDTAQVEDGIRTIAAKVTDSSNRTAEDSISVTIDTVNWVTIEDMGTQASNGLIIVTYEVPYDVENITITLENETDVVKIVQLSGGDITGEYIFEDELPVGAYQVTIETVDKAGNIAKDTVSFSVEQSFIADILDAVFGFFSAIIGVVTGIFGIGGLLWVVKRHRKDNTIAKKRKKDMCDLYGGDYCDI